MAGTTWVVGLDGCRRGWIAVITAGDHAQARVRFAMRLSDIADLPEPLSVIAVDIPIGLPERSGPRGRTPERLVRPLLGARQSSVFSIPSRMAVYAATDEAVPQSERFRHAGAIARATSVDGKAVSKQGFQIFPKIIEVDCLLRDRADLRERVFECHPEVSFWAMNGNAPILQPKKVKGAPCRRGLALRRDLLAAHGFDAGMLQTSMAQRCGAGLDDLIDACAAAWTAARIACGKATSFPDPPERDAVGLPVAIWA